MSFEAFGVQVELTLGDAELEAPVEEILPPGRRPCKTGASAGRFGLHQTAEDAYEVTFAGYPSMAHATLDVALTLLDAQMRLFIAANARDWLFVHAGVVAHGGRALVAPGDSFSGKTTLVRALLAAGATYYSDEYAVLDEAGRVHPYPRPLSIRSGDGGRCESTGRPTTAPPPATTQRRSGWWWSPVTGRAPNGGRSELSPGQGLVSLLANTVPAQDRPEESLRTLRWAMERATVLQGDRGDAGPVAAALLDELGPLSARYGRVQSRRSTVTRASSSAAARKIGNRIPTPPGAEPDTIGFSSPMIGDSPVDAGGAAAMRMGAARLPPVWGDGGPVPSIAGAVAATNCATARPAGPSDASWRRWPGVSWLPPGLPAGPDPGGAWLQLAPGIVSKYWSMPELPGGAHVTASALGVSANVARNSATVSRNALTPATRGSCRCRPRL